MNPFEILQNHTRYAVIGMSDDPERYAYRIFKKLEEKGKTVYGVSPKYKEIEGHTIYPTITEIPDDVDVAVFVVNPSIGIHLLEDVKAKGVKYAWLQPGTIDQPLLDKAETLDLPTVDACVLAVYSIHSNVL